LGVTDSRFDLNCEATTGQVEATSLALELSARTLFNNFALPAAQHRSPLPWHCFGSGVLAAVGAIRRKMLV
jgi:hypothetical protein